MNVLDIHQQFVDQRRGRYVRVSDTDRRQLIDAYRKGEDFIALAKKLNIKRSTARSILRTYIDEGRVSAKQRAGTRLRFITEEEAELIREMKRHHPLITIGQIQMRLQRTSNRVLSKASISRILTNSIRLGKRAKRSHENGEDKTNNEFMQLSSDEGTGGGMYIDEVDDDDEDEEEDEEMIDNPSTTQNLDDFQRFIFRKSSINGDESIGHEGLSWNIKEQYDENGCPAAGSDDDDDDDGGGGGDDESSEIEENDGKLTKNSPASTALTHSNVNENRRSSTENNAWTSVKSEPVCVFVNQNLESSDSEQLPPTDIALNKPMFNTQSTANRRIKICPICGEKNFSRLSHHLTVAHNVNRDESLTLLAYTDRNNLSQSSIASVSGSSPINCSTNHHLEKSPQPTPISINTNNQQITSTGPSPSINDSNHPNSLLTTSSSLIEQQSMNNGVSTDGKKRLLCPRCDTWVLNLTDHLIKKHHLVSKQERLPFLRLARNRDSLTNNNGKAINNAFLISPNDQQISPGVNTKYQNIIKKYRKNIDNLLPISSSPLPNSETSPLANVTSSKQISSGRNSAKDIVTHQKFEQYLSVFRQQFSVTVAIQNSLMQQMEVLQRCFVSIEEEWNDMKNGITESIS